MERDYEKAHRPGLLTSGHSAGLVTAIAAPKLASDAMFNIEFVPGIYGMSGEWATISHYLFNVLETEVPPSATLDGAYDDRGVSGNWTKVLTVTCPQRPVGHPASHAADGQRERLTEWNAEFKTDERTNYLASGMSQEHKAIFAWIAKRYFRVSMPTKVKLNVTSSLGLPGMSRDNEDRSLIVKMWLEHGTEILDLMATGRLDDLYIVWGIVLGYMAKNRFQNDSWEECSSDDPDAVLGGTSSKPVWYRPKLRPVYDEFREKFILAKKKFRMKDSDGHERVMSRKRTRPVAAVPMAGAFPLVVLAHCINANMYEDVVFKTKGAEDLEQRLESDAPRTEDGKCFRIRGDVSQSDSNQPPEALRILLEGLEEAYGALGSLAALMFHCPVLCVNAPESSGEEFERQALWSSNFRKKSGFRSRFVIPSGHPLTTAITTLMNMGTFLCGLWDKGYGYADFDALLKGLHKDFVAFFGGDNVAVSGRVDLGRFEELMTFVPCSDTERIMGNIPIREKSGHVRYKPDIRGLSDKLPGEYDLKSPLKAFPAHGAYMQRLVYLKNPSGELVYDIIEHAFRMKSLSKNGYIERWATIYKDPSKELGLVEALTLEEALLLYKPEMEHSLDIDTTRVDKIREQLAKEAGHMPLILDQNALYIMLRVLSQIPAFGWWRPITSTSI